jgi:P-type E1-E2 ATPase
VISELETMGVECAVLTGDREESAAAHGLANVHAGLSPVEKAELLRALAGRHRALFVGDGVNDGPALAEAHASLSLADGSGVARDVAMGEVRDLRAIPFALARCRAAVDAIRRNLLFAAAYNLVGISLAAAGVLHPVAAALLMLASSFTVSWSALRRPAIRISVPSAPALPSPAAVHA